MAKDILLNDQNELIFVRGDLDLGNSTGQDVKLILGSYRGEWKQWPLLGVGIDSYLNGPLDLARIEKTIKSGLRYDGLGNVRISVIDSNGPTISVNAERKQRDG